MGQMKNNLYDDEEADFRNEELEERVYPVRMQVDGYDVNHYYDGDVPVYEIYDADGEVLDVARSTNEMHEITENLKKNN